MKVCAPTLVQCRFRARPDHQPATCASCGRRLAAWSFHDRCANCTRSLRMRRHPAPARIGGVR